MPHTKLTEAQAIQIFRSKLDLPQLSSAALATIYCVSEKAVRDIWTGRTWSRETWHLNTLRTIQQKQPGRPKGRRDTQPRKKCARKMHNEESSSMLTGPLPSSPSTSPSKWLGGLGPILDPPPQDLEAEFCLKTRCQLSHLGVQGYGTVCADEAAEACFNRASSWHQSDPRLWYNMVERRPTQLYTSMDEQLHDWGVFWSSFPTADPFRSDWRPKPFEYA